MMYQDKSRQLPLQMHPPESMPFVVPRCVLLLYPVARFHPSEIYGRKKPKQARKRRSLWPVSNLLRAKPDIYEKDIPQSPSPARHHLKTRAAHYRVCPAADVHSHRMYASEPYSEGNDLAPGYDAQRQNPESVYAALPMESSVISFRFAHYNNRILPTEAE